MRHDDGERRYASLEDYQIDAERRRAGYPSLWESAEEAHQRRARDRREAERLYNRSRR